MPRPGSTVTHPKLARGLRHAHLSTVTIQRRTVTGRDATGGEIEGWATLHGDLPCQVAEAIVAQGSGRSSERRQDDVSYPVNGKIIGLLGLYTDITNADRAIEGGVTYNITAVERDSQGIRARLICEKVG